MIILIQRASSIQGIVKLLVTVDWFFTLEPLGRSRANNFVLSEVTVYGRGERTGTNSVTKVCGDTEGSSNIIVSTDTEGTEETEDTEDTVKNVGPGDPGVKDLLDTVDTTATTDT